MLVFKRCDSYYLIIFSNIIKQNNYLKISNKISKKIYFSKVIFYHKGYCIIKAFFNWKKKDREHRTDHFFVGNFLISSMFMKIALDVSLHNQHDIGHHSFFNNSLFFTFSCSLFFLHVMVDLTSCGFDYFILLVVMKN